MHFNIDNDYKMVPSHNRFNISSLIAEFEKNEKISYESEYDYDKNSIDICNSSCSACYTKSQCYDWYCRNIEECISDVGNNSARNFCYLHMVERSCGIQENSSVCPCEDFVHACLISDHLTSSCDNYCGECPCEYIQRDCNDCSKFYDYIDNQQRTLKDRLNPSNKTHSISTDIHEIKGDGSLRNGGEVTTIGRKISWDRLVGINRKLSKEILNTGATTNSLTGGHMHYLLGYQFNIDTRDIIHEHETSIPMDVLVNLYSIVTYFIDSLVWITSTGAASDEFTRPLIYRSLPSSPIRDLHLDVNSFRSFLSSLSERNDRYSYLYPGHCRFNTSTISIFHLEFRVPDAFLSGVAISAVEILFAAMVRKAVKLLEEGVIIFNNTKAYKAIRMAKRMMGENYSYPSSNSHFVTPLSEKEKVFIISKTKSFLDWIKPEILFYGIEPFMVLSSLAKEPCSTLRSEGKDWGEIDTRLYRISNKRKDSNSRKLNSLVSEISKSKVHKDNPLDWMMEFANKNSLELKTVHSFIINNKNIHWDEDGGKFIVT